MNPKQRHDPRKSEEKARGILQRETWHSSQVVSVTLVAPTISTNVCGGFFSEKQAAKTIVRWQTRNFIGAIPLWAMTSLSYLIGWGWHLERRVLQDLPFRHIFANLLPRTQTHHALLIHEAPMLPFEKQNSVTLKYVSSHVQANGQLRETSVCQWH